MENSNLTLLLNDPEMKEIVESFITETKEILDSLDTDLVDMEKTPDDADLINRIFRAFHTIKGTSGFLGLDKLTNVTHHCEDILNKIRKGDAKVSSELMDGILASYDKIKELLYSIESSHSENVDVEDTIANLKTLLDILEGKKVQVSNSKTAKDIAKRTPSKKTSGKKAKKIDTIPGDNHEIKPADQISEDKKNDEENISIEETPKPVISEKSKKQFSKLDSTNNKHEDTVIRVEVERLDQLLNIVSELVLGRNQLAQVNAEASLEYEGTKLSRDLFEATKQIDLMTNELQLVVMKTRMVKIGRVFNRFPRLIRDLSKEMNKEIKLVVLGEETELDKTLIDEIYDPLVHIIRNSVDHGIEQKEVRKKAGKDPVGTIILSAEHQGNDIIISIEDDGKGIDPEVIKEKAISKGILTEARAKELSLHETFNLVFLPGFSTATVVTNVSGRGVGMDVVRTNVSKLRGIINIESVPGKGTKLIIKLPLTLAIISGMVVRVGKELYVIPLNSVVEVIREHIDNISSINGNQVIRVRDTVLPLIDLGGLRRSNNGDTEDKVWQFVVMVGIAEKRFGIKVDELIGQKEVVIKSLGNYLGNVKGIAGSTIMGDGTVIMILDIAELVNQRKGQLIA